MTATQRTIQRARRRWVWQSFLRAAGYALLIGLIVLLLLQPASQWWGFSIPVWIYGAAAGLALFVAAGWAWVRRPGVDQMAVRVDARLRLKDRLGTVLYAENLPGNAWTRKVQEDAEASAASTRGDAEWRRSFSVRPTPVWGGVVAAGLLLLLAMTDPAGLQRLAQQRAAEAAGALQDTQQIRQVISQAAEQAKSAEPLAEPAPDQEGLNAEDADGVFDPATLDERLEAMLARRDLHDLADRQQAAAEVSDLQQRYEQAVEREQDRAEAVRNALSSVDPGERGPADRFADALRRGDFAAAQQELGRLADEIEKGDLSPNQQRQLAEQTSTMADQLGQVAEQQAAAAAQRRGQSAGTQTPAESASSSADDAAATQAAQATQADDAAGGPPDAASADAASASDAGEGDGAYASAPVPSSEALASDSGALEKAQEQAQQHEAAEQTAGRLSDRLRRMAEALGQADAAADRPDAKKENASDPSATASASDSAHSSSNPDSDTPNGPASPSSASDTVAEGTKTAPLPPGEAMRQLQQELARSDCAATPGQTDAGHQRPDAGRGATDGRPRLGPDPARHADHPNRRRFLYGPG